MNLFERNQQTVLYAYHGTSSNNVPDILKHGLQPYREKTAYNTDNPNDFDAGLKTMGGVYLTTLEKVALNHAYHATDTFGGQPVIVKVQYTVGSENLDEDDLYLWVRNAIISYPNPRGDFTLPYSENEVAQRLDSIYENDPHIKNEILAKFKNTFRVSEKADLSPLWQLFVLITEEEFEAGELINNNGLDWVRQLYDESPMAWRKMRRLVKQIIGITKRPLNVNQGDRSFRLTRPVGFRGKTKIVEIKGHGIYSDKYFYQEPEQDHFMNMNEEYNHQQALEDTGYWGTAGAGCLIVANDTKRILLPKRSAWVQEPHTWATWGGAIDKGEDPQTAAMREVEEEAGFSGKVMKMIHLYTFADNDFRYDTYAAVVEHEFEPVLNWETEDTQWVEFGKWPSPLHFGLEGVLKDSSAMNKLGMLTTK